MAFSRLCFRSLQSQRQSWHDLVLRGNSDGSRPCLLLEIIITSDVLCWRAESTWQRHRLERVSEDGLRILVLLKQKFSAFGSQGKS